MYAIRSYYAVFWRPGCRIHVKSMVRRRIGTNKIGDRLLRVAISHVRIPGYACFGSGPVQQRQVHRITSYNVCYTKLLRTPYTLPLRATVGLKESITLSMKGSLVISRKFCSGFSVCICDPELYRITSYNVCYTKLLRQFSSVFRAMVSMLRRSSGRSAGSGVTIERSAEVTVVQNISRKETRYLIEVATMVTFR